MQKVTKLRIAVAILVSLLAFSLTNTAFAAAPVPQGGAANVDGNISEWGVDRNNPTADNDYFANLYEAWKTDKPVFGYLYLRYDPSNGVLYALVLVSETVTGLTVNPGGDQHIKIGMLGSGTAVDRQTGDDGTAPDFAYVYATPGDTTTKLLGYEASVAVGPKPFTTTIRVHLAITLGDSDTAGTGGKDIPLVVPPDFVVPEYALGGLAALGACFAGLVIYKKRISLPRLRRN